MKEGSPEAVIKNVSNFNDEARKGCVLLAGLFVGWMMGGLENVNPTCVAVVEIKRIPSTKAAAADIVVVVTIAKLQSGILQSLIKFTSEWQ